MEYAYAKKIELVKSSLVSYCKGCVTENWENMIDDWLDCEADMEFGHEFQNTFKAQFSNYMNPVMDGLLLLSGKNIICAIKAFKAYKKDISLDDVLQFTELFVSEQMQDFLLEGLALEFRDK